MKREHRLSTVGQAERWLWLAWLLFVVYGSLVPLDFEPLSMTEALDRFSRIHLLDVGLQGRADWVANGVLYLPVGFLGTMVLADKGRRHWAPAGLGALLSGVALALAVEFTQLFFPPRTVSLNDLVAEGIGCLLGVVAAGLGMRYWQKILAHWHGQRRRLAAHVMPLGVGTLFVFSLFPFDVLVSGTELSGKLGGDFCAWWLAPVFVKDGWALALARLLAEFLTVLPLGAWWGRRSVRQQPAGAATVPWRWMLRGAWRGAALGLLLELAQLFVASGVSQGLSVLTRAAAWGVGAVLGVLSASWRVPQWQALLRRWTWPVLTGCLLAAAVKAGWLSASWTGAAEAGARLLSGEIHFLPFYYHYFTSEGAAVQSTVPVLLLFAPMGVLAWAWGRPPWLAGLGAALAAAVTEAGRLFMADVRPDPTNALIAGAAAAAVAWLLHQTLSGVPVLVSQSVPGQADKVPVPAAARQPAEAAWRSPALWIALVLTAVWLWRFPVYQAGVGLMLLTGACLVWWRPAWLLAVVMASLPVLNLTVWSGREYVDEFDVLLLLCAAVAWARRGTSPRRAVDDGVLAAVVALVAGSVLVSAVLGWSPWDVQALAHPDGPLSPWYAVRLFKGAFLAGLLGRVIWQQQTAGEPVQQALLVGMVVGLAGVVAWVMWERKVFVGLFNFSADYRVAGPVLPMRLGGAYLDTFLVVSLPFALVGALYARNGWWRGVCGVTAMGAAYATAVTFTRSTYLAAALAAGMVAAGSLRPWPGRGNMRWLPASGLLLLLAVAAYPIVTGPFATARMALVAQDASTRLEHARNVVSMRDDDVLTELIGQGLGRFPARSYWARQWSKATSGGMGVHRFLQEEGVSLLQLGAGPMLYLDQAMVGPFGDQVRITARVRASGPGGKLEIDLCQKWLLASDNCAAHTFVLQPGSGWQNLAATVKTGPALQATGWPRRPVRLTIYNAGPTRLDVDSVSLLNAQGDELVRNGDFDLGSDHWSYASDDHLAWHVKNMALAVWFDLGWLGVAAFGSLFGLALLRSSRTAWSGNRSAQALLAALAGLMVVAVFDSVVDEPRFLLLLLLLLWLAARRGPMAPAAPERGTA